MSNKTSRRGFLKGVFAASAAVAVSPIIPDDCLTSGSSPPSSGSFNKISSFEKTSIQIEKVNLLKDFNGHFEKKLYWSRTPGKFVSKDTGEDYSLYMRNIGYDGPRFQGTVREWYETYVETIIDCHDQLKKKYYEILLDKGLVKKDPKIEDIPINIENFLLPSLDCLTIMEASIMYKPLLWSKDLTKDKRDFYPFDFEGTLSSRMKVLSIPRDGKEVLFTHPIPRNQTYVILHDHENDITLYGCVHVLDMNII